MPQRGYATGHNLSTLRRPAQWVTMHNIQAYFFFREMWFIDCSCTQKYGIDGTKHTPSTFLLTVNYQAPYTDVTVMLLNIHLDAQQSLILSGFFSLFI